MTPALRAILFRANPRWDPEPLFTTPITVTAITQAVLGQDSATKLLYGVDSANGHYVTSVDGVTWTDRTHSLSTYTPNMVAMEFDTTYMYAICSDGKLYRSALNVFDGWSEISVAGRGALTSGRPGSLCPVGSDVLLYGNYTTGDGDGAHIWRSTDAGTNWTEVLVYAGGKHVHAIRRNAATGVIWASLGDTGFTGIGLHKSTDGGATWTYMSSSRYGIDMEFVPALDSRRAQVILEADGANERHLVSFQQDAGAGEPTNFLTKYNSRYGEAMNLVGTTRGIGLCPTGDVIYFATTEGGAVGDTAGIFVTASPKLNSHVMMKNTTGAEPVYYGHTYIVNGLVFNYRSRFVMPQFSNVTRENSLVNSRLLGGGAAPTGYARPGGTGTSAPIASTLAFGDGATAYEQTATAQRPFLQHSVDQAVSANSQYSFSLYIESYAGTIAVNNAMCYVSVPAGATVSYYLDNAPIDSTATIAATGRLRAVLRTGATAGTVQRRLGLGSTSASTGTLVFSRPQFEARDFTGPFTPT
jgi:hypothetical protein